MKKTIVALLIYCCINKFGECARILGVFQYPSYSHQMVYQAVCNELANRGHEVTIFTTNPQKNVSRSNLREIDISFMYGSRRVTYDVATLEGLNSGKKFLITNFKTIGKMLEKIYQHPEMQALLKQKNLTFDLLIVDLVYPSMVALSVRFKCPYIGMSTMDIIDPLLKDIGNYYNPVVFPSIFFPRIENLSFWERLQSVQFSIWYKFYFYNVVYSASDELVKKYLGKDYPPIKEIVGNVSVFFYNANPIFSKVRPNIPTVIEFSGLHIKPAQPLPENLKTFLDDAPYGVIYFSLGSNIQSSALPFEMKSIFLETFRELKYKVLWKFEDANLTNLPGNLKIAKWLPQQDILAHPNVKVFLTQGGLQSSEESLWKRVPMVGIPFFMDQVKNTYYIEKLGIGKRIERTSLTKESLKNALIEVAENQKYRMNIKKLANILEDQHVKPMDKIIWWTEYVIRHKGCAHLRSPLLDIPFYQYHYLDIAAFCLLILLSVTITSYYVMKYIIRYLYPLFKQHVKKMKKS